MMLFGKTCPFIVGMNPEGPNGAIFWASLKDLWASSLPR